MGKVNEQEFLQVQLQDVFGIGLEVRGEKEDIDACEELEITFDHRS